MTTDFILNKFKLSSEKTIEIPNVGRKDLALLFKELNFNTGVEIGVLEGIYSEILCKANPNLELFCIDPWRIYTGYRDYSKHAEMEKFYQNTKTRLAPYKCKIIRDFSTNAIDDFEDDSLDFVYIDGNHEYPFVTRDIIEWTKKVKRDGIVSGHDYYTSNRHDSKNHTVYAVDAYIKAYRIEHLFLLGRKAKIEGEIRDTERSWFFVKS